MTSTLAFPGYRQFSCLHPRLRPSHSIEDIPRSSLTNEIFFQSSCNLGAPSSNSDQPTTAQLLNEISSEKYVCWKKGCKEQKEFWISNREERLSNENDDRLQDATSAVGMRYSILDSPRRKFPTFCSPIAVYAQNGSISLHRDSLSSSRHLL